MTDVLVPARDVAFREIDGEVVILDLDSGSYFGLNAVGSRAWVLLAQGRTLKDVHAQLLIEYDVTADALQRDLLEWAGGLMDRNLLRTDPA